VTVRSWVNRKVTANSEALNEHVSMWYFKGLEHDRLSPRGGPKIRPSPAKRFWVIIRKVGFKSHLNY
jgi:hypothetical protein